MAAAGYDIGASASTSSSATSGNTGAVQIGGVSASKTDWTLIFVVLVAGVLLLLFLLKRK